MKKVVALVFVLMLGVFAIAEGINLDSYTNDELKSLFVDVKNELFKRGIVKRFDLSEGAYFVGSDIPAGSYKITSIDKSSYSVNSCLYVFWSVENYNAYVDLKKKENIAVDPALIWNDQTYKLDFEEGYVLLVTKGVIRFEEMSDTFTK